MYTIKCETKKEHVPSTKEEKGLAYKNNTNNAVTR